MTAPLPEQPGRLARIVDDIKRPWKAIVAFVAPGAVVIGSAVAEASDGGSRITAAEWVTALVACVVTSAAVFSTPNPKVDVDEAAA